MPKLTDTREKLLETAITLIWQSSYSDVGVAEICKQAGVTKGSFYHYFETKADLFYAACQHDWEITKKELDTLFSPSYTALEQLENLISFIIEKEERNAVECMPVTGCPIFTAGAQCGCDDQKVRQAALEMSENALTYNTALIRNLKAEGVLNGDPQPRQVGRLLHQYIEGLLVFGRVYRSLDMVKEDLREGLYRLVDLKQEYRQGGVQGDGEPLSAA
ncbi:TetR/AcrR family transcriptional regulator [Exilibacterium tricleocarpae]|uniref:TetR/AcrR family transcriptional regulator n=1 Tax=Exilibacterium tricleocarpae TaxID=2591008 RepID=A0A545U9X3_9GAMM|nr:TetR/AcrR family transcriptional regulator [Exilibacterium tricleocarpae]TQV86270.1 TetR/AcrR family transcriptional regulator [Exilibacterium tricleocarpae]